MSPLPNSSSDSAAEMLGKAFTVQVGDIVQVMPGHEKFGGCMVTVTESRFWGLTGYVQSAGVKGQQYIRLTWGEIAPTGGKAVWVTAMPVLP